MPRPDDHQLMHQIRKVAAEASGVPAASIGSCLIVFATTDGAVGVIGVTGSAEESVSLMAAALHRVVNGGIPEFSPHHHN